MEYFTQSLENLESCLKEIHAKSTTVYVESEDSITACKEVLLSLRLRVEKNDFQDHDQECIFFKTVKPKIVGYAIHHMNLLQMEKSRPFGNAKTDRKFNLAQIGFLQSYFWEYKEFYEYHIRGHIYRDKEFFLRNNDSYKFHFEAIPTMTDANFSTSHDLVLAKILGNLMTIEHLEKKIICGTPNSSSTPIIEHISTLIWTGSKVDFIELTYALYYSGRINNGQATLQEVSQALGKILNMDPGDIYRTYIEIRARKTNPTKFLDALKQNLLHKMEEADG